MAAILLFFASVPTARADTPVTLFKSWAGNINITGTAGTLRTNPDGVNSCSVTNSGTMDLEGVPLGSTIVAAYLYWAGSGGGAGEVPADYNVNLNGSAINADRTYTASYNAGGGDVLNYFGGVADVTSMVQASGNGIYTFSGLTVQNTDVYGGATYCSNAAVLSAFALVVVYSNPAESLHVVNLWEGLQTYRGSDIVLSPNNFVVPNTNISGRHLVLTWEGDSGNSGSYNGYNENLTFCAPGPTCVGNPLTDGYNPLNNQFNSTVDVYPNGPFTGVNSTWGVDLDVYNISGYLHAGDASAVADYSSGADLVILANQTMSISNAPVADLAMSVSHTGTFSVGQNGIFTLGVTNNGPSDATGVTVTDTLPSGLNFVSATGTGWSCSDSGQTVTCTQTGTLGSGSSASPITLTTAVGSAAYPSVTDSASVSATTFDNVSANNTASDTATVIASNLSTSTKTVVDTNGGDSNPGDTLEYTITLNESGGVQATGVSVTDDIPANVTGFRVVSTPSGATDNSTTTGGSNGTGHLDIGNITVPANGSVAIVYDVTVAAGTSPGTTIDNTATISNPGGPGATPAAPTITVSASAVPSGPNKPLYLYDNLSSPAYKLSRTSTPTSPTPNTIQIAGGSSQTWTESPALAGSDTISNLVSSSVPVYLTMAGSSYRRTRSFTVSLYCSSDPSTALSASGSTTGYNTPTLYTVNLPFTSTVPSITCSPPNAWVLKVANTEGNYRRWIDVYPVNGTDISRVVLPSQNVINVASVTGYSAAYPATSTPASGYFGGGQTVHIRAVISDPFGSYDIDPADSPTITIKTPNGNTLVANAAMGAAVVDSGVATKTYEYAYNIPTTGPAGTWSVSVTANEGTEGIVSRSGTGTFKVGLPDLTVVKSVFTQSDPVHGTTNPFSIPGAIMRYEVLVSNSGHGSPDAGSLDISDTIPANTALIVSNPPVVFVDGSTSSGVSFTYGGLNSTTDDVEFCAGTNCNYVPTVGADSTDPNVTQIKILPKGTMAADGGSGAPNFTVKFWVRIK